MKLYTFINSYIYGIQVGIQASHSNIEFMNEHGDNEEVKEWASDHKTFIWLDGGDANQMIENIKLLQDAGFSVSYFREPGLGNIVTSFSVLITESVLKECVIYEATQASTSENFSYTGRHILTTPSAVLKLLVNSRSKRI